MLALRDYQREALEAVERAEAEGCRRQVVSTPPGTGKTVIFAHKIAAGRGGGRAVILAHRDELIGQAAEKVLAAWPEAPLGVVKAERDETGARVILASVQTLARRARLERLLGALGGGPGLVVVDECHHAPAPSFRRVIEALASMPSSPLLLGFTATPQRADGAGLDRVFERVVYHRSIDDMIAAGWLVPPRGWLVPLPADLRGVRVRGGDFAEADLEAALNRPELNEAVARAWLERGGDRVTLAFCAGVRHAFALAEAVNRLAGPGTAAAVSGATPPEERARLVQALRDGQLRLLANCQVLTEGFDAPAVSCLLMLRPTRSQPFYVQMVGRGLRPAPWAGKEDCLVLDFAGVTQDLGLVTLPVIFGLGGVRDLAGRTPGEAREARRVRLLAGGEAREVPVVTKPRRRFNWLAAGDGGAAWALSLPPRPGMAEERWFFVRQDAGGAWLAEYAELTASLAGRIVSKRVEIYRSAPGALTGQATAFGAAETVAASDPAARFAAQSAAWRRRNEPATPKQISALRAFGVAPRPGLTKAEASDIISAVLAARRLRAIERAAAR